MRQSVARRRCRNRAGPRNSQAEAGEDSGADDGAEAEQKPPYLAVTFGESELAFGPPGVQLAVLGAAGGQLRTAVEVVGGQRFGLDVGDDARRGAVGDGVPVHVDAPLRTVGWSCPGAGRSNG